MKVTLLSWTKNPEEVIAAAARCCYSNDDPEKLLDGMDKEKAEKMIRGLIASGHFSALEHASFTFSISGVSRTFLAQVTRHRIGTSFSVRSQRYCDMNTAEKVCPPSIKAQHELLEEFNNGIYVASAQYEKLMAAGASKEDARFVLPEATMTSMVMTMNARELLHFFSLRCCIRAQWEIRSVANEMLRLVRNEAPTLFEKGGASCVQLGYCPENKRSCGKAPTLEQVLLAYKTRAVQTCQPPA